MIQTHDFFDGLAGSDTIVIAPILAPDELASILIFRTLTDTTHGFHSYEALRFTNTVGDASVAIDAEQFGAGLISEALAITGVDGGFQFISVRNASNFSAAAWTFVDWDSDGFEDPIGLGGTQATKTSQLE